MIRIGVLGYGYWGPNLVRNIVRIPNTQVSWICDIDSTLLRDIPRLYPTTATTKDVGDLLKDPKTDAVVIATPISTHVPLAKRALAAGKHVLVEKPLAPSRREAQELVQLARAKKRVLMVDHTYLYTPEVKKIRDIVQNGELGTIFFVDSVRTNLGLIQRDANVIYDLATHDFSILDFILGLAPTSVSATGFPHKGTNQEAVAYITARYPKGVFAHICVSWLSPVKIRTMTFVGTKKMLVYNDMEPSEKIQIYDKSISVRPNQRARYQLRIGYRIGSMVAPHIPVKEGLHGMVQAFVTAIKRGTTPASDGKSGVRVVTCIEAATRSLRKNGEELRL